MISVCIATYNGEKYIQEQIESILPQLAEVDEIILSDDNSSDKTIEIIKSLNDSRIKIFVNKLGKGYSKNFENAILHSSGDIIFLSDQDDVWISGKVNKMKVLLLSADLVVSDAEIVDEYLYTIAPSHFVLREVKSGFFNNFAKTRYIGACMAFKRSILTKALPFPKKSKYCAHDYWLTIIAELYYKVALIREPLIKYRRHGLNASSGGDSSPFTFQKKIITRIYALSVLISRVWK